MFFFSFKSDYISLMAKLQLITSFFFLSKTIDTCLMTESRKNPHVLLETSLNILNKHG